MIAGDLNDFLETVWKNAQGQEMRFEPPKIALSTQRQYTYKILKKQLVLRAPHFTLYKGIEKCREYATNSPAQNANATVNFREVAIKKYEIVSRDPKAKEIRYEPTQPAVLQATKALPKMGSKFYQYNQDYYALMNYLDETLYEKIKYGVKQFKVIKQLKEAKLLKGELLTDFFKHTLEDLLNFHKSSPPIFLGRLCPTYIGVIDKFNGEHKKSYSYFIIDCALANIQPSQCLQSYDRAYLAPQYLSKIDEKADIWSIGCILYELVSFGEKLVFDLAFHQLDSEDKQRFVQDRLNELIYRVEYFNNNRGSLSKSKIPLGVVNILRRCLEVNPKERPSAEELLAMAREERPFLTQPRNTLKLSEEQSSYYENKLIYDINMEIFRLNCIQDGIMSVFEEIFFNKLKTVSKFHLYPLVRFASCYYLEVFNKLKEKSRFYANNQKWDKYSQVKRIQEEKKMSEIRDKAASKMLKELELEQETEKKIEQRVILKHFPQVKDDKVVDPRERFRVYLKAVGSQFCKIENSNFYKFMVCMHFYMKDLPEMQKYLNTCTGGQISLKITQKQLKQRGDPQIIYFYHVTEIMRQFEGRISLIFSSEHKEGPRARSEIEAKMLEYLQMAVRPK